ncbi:DUF4395 domain-containing protein [Aquipuribacter sp. SD81]|uniref:DUF4395 domain-containing protein n=1 Tax=Aquipuribacter sp. SD81 TaxID=3127703 RepID=UPI00301912FB
MTGTAIAPGTAAGPRPPGAVDPRGPRVAAAGTSLVLAATVLTGSVWLLALQAVVFALTVVLGPGRGPWGALFRVAVRPRLGPPAFWEDAAAPRFAQLVGLGVVGAGLALWALGVPGAVVGSAAAALVAAGLNAGFGICLGCALYRAGLRRRRLSRRASGRPAP